MEGKKETLWEKEDFKTRYRYWQIAVHFSIPHLSCKKTAESRSGCPEHWTIYNHKPKSVLKCTVYDHNARPSQTDRQTDKHHGNSATIRSNEGIACYNNNEAMIQNLKAGCVGQRCADADILASASVRVRGFCVRVRTFLWMASEATCQILRSSSTSLNTLLVKWKTNKTADSETSWILKSKEMSLSRFHKHKQCAALHALHKSV